MQAAVQILTKITSTSSEDGQFIFLLNLNSEELVGRRRKEEARTGRGEEESNIGQLCGSFAYNNNRII